MAFRAPNRTLLAVGFGDKSHRYWDAYKTDLFYTARASCFTADKGGTAGPSSFY